MQEQPNEKQSRSDYQREWRKANAAKIAAYRKAYRKAHPERVKAWARKHYEEHGEKIKERSRKRHIEHRDEILARQRVYYQEKREEFAVAARAYRERNKEAVRRRKREHYELNRVQWRSYKAASRARAFGNHADLVDYPSIIERDRQTCHICGVLVLDAELQFDHKIPLSKGGSHTTENVGVAHAACNAKKGRSLPNA